MRRHFKVMCDILKESLGVTSNLKWSLVRRATPYPNFLIKCVLCLYEKLVITIYPRQYEFLNKLSEIFWKCLHDNKYLLKTLELLTKSN